MLQSSVTDTGLWAFGTNVRASEELAPFSKQDALISESFDTEMVGRRETARVLDEMKDVARQAQIAAGFNEVGGINLAGISGPNFEMFASAEIPLSAMAEIQNATASAQQQIATSAAGAALVELAKINAGAQSGESNFDAQVANVAGARPTPVDTAMIVAA